MTFVECSREVLYMLAVRQYDREKAKSRVGVLRLTALWRSEYRVAQPFEKLESPQKMKVVQDVR